jgi:replicative DNA helicase
MSEEKKEDIALERWRGLRNKDEVVHIKDATEREGKYTTPYPIGFDILDTEMKGGVREGDLIVFTGMSGHGKTTACQAISLNLSNIGLSSLWFSYEVLIDNVYAKFSEMGMPPEKLKVFTPKKMKSGNLEWIQQKIIEGVEKFGTKFIFIDHLDFITPKKQTDDQRRIVISDICTELKELAKELRVVIFLIAHVKKVQGRAIEMQDISESGATYKIADAVFVVEREVFIEDVGGRKTEVYKTSNGTIRMLKNRIGGTYPIMFFQMFNNVIVPIETRVNSNNEELNIEVVDEDKEKNVSLFGIKED